MSGKNTSTQQTDTVFPLQIMAVSGSDRKQWIQLLPAGKIETADNRGPFYARNLEAIIQASVAGAKATHGLIAVDYDHGIDLAASSGKPAPAAGWIAQMEARSDGIWGLVEWTPRAFKEVNSREYRFLSPALGIDAKKEVKLIFRASVTNNPNLTMFSLNTAQKGNSMETDETFLNALRQALGLTDDADRQTILDKVASITQNSAHSVDPAQYVPMSIFQETVKELKRLNSGITRAAAEREADKAVENMQIFPFMREWAVELCTINKPAFDDFINGVAKGLTVLQSMRAPSPCAALAERERFKKPEKIDSMIAANLGLSENDIETYGA